MICLIMVLPAIKLGLAQKGTYGDGPDDVSAVGVIKGLTDDQLLEKFLDGKEPSTEELKKAIREGTRDRNIFPILFGAPLRQIGIAQLLDAVIDYLPSPLDEGEEEGVNPANGETIKRAADPNAPFSAYVFKTVIDPFAGKLSIMRVMSGKIAPDVTCYVPSRQVKEKMGHLFRL